MSPTVSAARGTILLLVDGDTTFFALVSPPAAACWRDPAIPFAQ